MSQKVAADMAGVEVVQEEIMHVFVHASGKGIKWRTSDQRTGGEASFSDLKDEKKLRAYLTKCFGSKKTFTVEVRESELVEGEYKHKDGSTYVAKKTTKGGVIFDVNGKDVELTNDKIAKMLKKI
jgi:hypothetical protein